MKRLAFISRHHPTATQFELANESGYELVHVGDVDAFSDDLDVVKEMGCDAVCCVHPAIAMKAAALGYPVSVFENGNRAPEGEKPQFFAKKLWLYGR